MVHRRRLLVLLLDHGLVAEPSLDPGLSVLVAVGSFFASGSVPSAGWSRNAGISASQCGTSLLMLVVTQAAGSGESSIATLALRSIADRIDSLLVDLVGFVGAGLDIG
jgi:hypothetical protein